MNLAHFLLAALIFGVAAAIFLPTAGRLFRG